MAQLSNVSSPSPGKTAQTPRTSSTTQSDAVSVASSITMESFNLLQSKVDKQDQRLEHMSLILGKIASSVLKEDRDGHPTSSKENKETGSHVGTGKGQ